MAERRLADPPEGCGAGYHDISHHRRGSDAQEGATRRRTAERRRPHRQLSPEAPMTTNGEILFDALAELSPDKLDLIGVIARSIVEFHSATAADAKRIAAGIATAIAELTEAAVEDAQEDDGGAGERILAKLADMAERDDPLSGDDLLFLAAKASRAELTAHILRLDNNLASERQSHGKTLQSLTDANERFARAESRGDKLYAENTALTE